MIDEMGKFVVSEIAALLDVPDEAYEAATHRYEDVGNWLDDSENARSAGFNPHIYPQGSFALGTVTRPWKREDFDLDLGCELREGITKTSHTQSELKEIVGLDLEQYRKRRNIQQELEEKHRCWRLYYKDDLSFHMDIVPCIPEAQDVRRVLNERMIGAGTSAELAEEVSGMAVAITDNEEANFPVLSQEWQISNPRGYVVWFKSRLREAQVLLESRAKNEQVAKIDDLPVYRWKTPLQQCIQILKRHRDVMFEKDADLKPISVIITTLAGRAYQGETDLRSTMLNVTTQLGGLVSSSEPRVPNPVNPIEDFADKWAKNSQLEESFWKWIKRVKADFEYLLQEDNVERLKEAGLRKYGVQMNVAKLEKQRGLLQKAGLIAAGSAFTASDGTIGDTGIKNKPHKFYG